MVRATRKPKQALYVTEDSFGCMKKVFEFQYQDYPNVQSAWNPSMDIFETEEDYVILIEAAGLNEETLELHAIDKRLVLSGERRQFFEEPVLRYHQLEIQFMPFQKTIILPDVVDENQVKANYRNGMLIIRVSKKCKKGKSEK
jgi:HSP20 family protein